MFAVLFEVHPKAGAMGHVPRLRQDAPPRAGADRRLCRQYPLSQPYPRRLALSLSNWRDEKALVRWRTQMRCTTRSRKKAAPKSSRTITCESAS